MWCTSCRQDVPGLASAEPSRFSCARCGSILRIDAPGRALGGHAAQAPPPESNDTPQRQIGPWEQWKLQQWCLQEQLRHAQRVLHAHARVDEARARCTVRFDPPQPISLDQPPAASRGPSVQEPPRRRATAAAWLSNCAAAGLLSCGTALAVWGVVAGRGELVDLGLPIVMAGQVPLIVSLVLHFERRGRTAVDETRTWPAQAATNPTVPPARYGVASQ